MTDQFHSSDSVRSARPLHHARSAHLPQPFACELGGELPGITVCYETWGTLAADGGNAVLVFHALTGDSHAARHDGTDDPGWWDLVIGPGCAIDTRRWFVICANVLGSCRGSTGPTSLNPATGQPWAGAFPTITVGDMVEAQRRLVDHLGIRRLAAVVGASMGGMLAMTWAIRHPERTGRVIATAVGPRMNSQALAIDVVGRNAILQDPDYRNGDYRGMGPETGLALARMLGHITYLSREAMSAKFEADRHRPRPVDTDFETRFSVGSYLAYQGGRFVERFDANSYLRLLLAVDLFDLGADHAQLTASLATARVPWLVVSFSSDWLFPSDQARAVVQALVADGIPVSYLDVPSRAGHDAFLLAEELPVYAAAVAAFLGDGAPAATAAPAPAEPRRFDLERIVELISPADAVLDLGCGAGALLTRLRARGGTRLLGIEKDVASLTRAIAQGVDVLHADLDEGLGRFADRSFDVVVLSQTLPAVRNVSATLAELVRVGRRGIVTFPNLGHWRHRETLGEAGRCPELVPGLPWWRSPLTRPFSIDDFEDCCADLGLRIEERQFLDLARGLPVRDDPNRKADAALYVIGQR